MRHPRPAAATILASAALLVGFAGCGGDEESTTTESDARTEYIAQVNEICTETTATIEAGTQEQLAGVQQPEVKDITTVVSDVTVPALREQYEQIEAIDPPAGDEEAVDDILTKADAAIDEIERDPSAMVDVEGRPTPFDETSAALADYGITACG